MCGYSLSIEDLKPTPTMTLPTTRSLLLIVTFHVSSIQTHGSMEGKTYSNQQFLHFIAGNSKGGLFYIRGKVYYSRLTEPTFTQLNLSFSVLPSAILHSLRIFYFKVVIIDSFSYKKHYCGI